MQAPQQILKPENRQDFESLCKKLRGEIWQCPEIKKNWRQWQTQNGVDVYWMPKWEQSYFWIQCKWKDHYTHAQLTTREIDSEIEKAENFQPKLAKLYFATTANKDSNIEEYIRLKNTSQIKSWSFEIHIYSWEDIVDLIKDNENTYNYYVNSMNFINQYAIDISFEDWTKEINKEVLFLRTKKIYKHKAVQSNDYNDLLKELYSTNQSFLNNFYDNNHLENESKFDFKIKLKNIGTKQLDNFKIQLSFTWNINKIYNYESNIFIEYKNRYKDCYIENESRAGILEKPKDRFLVPQDSYIFQEIWCLPNKNSWKITINWSFLSKEYNIDWQLFINVSASVIDNEEIIDIKTTEEEREEIIIEELIWTNELVERLKKQKWTKYSL